MWNFCGVAVYHTSMINWGRGGTSVQSICPSCYIWNVLSVAVYNTSMVNWRGLWYMCILLYVKLMWCSSIPYIYGQLERGYICHKYVCILPYVKLMWCSGILEIYGWLEGGTCARGICAYCYMLNLCSVVVFHTSMVNWMRGPWYMCIVICETSFV